VILMLLPACWLAPVEFPADGTRPVLAFSADSLSFGVDGGAGEVLLRNDGDLPLGVRDAGLLRGSAFSARLAPERATGADGQPVDVGEVDLVVPPGASVPVEVTYTAAVLGGVEWDVLEVETFGKGGEDAPWADPRRSRATLVLLGGGTGWPQPVLAGRHTVPRVYEPTDVRPTVRNLGTRPFTVIDLLKDSECADFAVESLPLPFEVASGGSMAIPAAYGPDFQSCILVVTTDAAHRPALTTVVTTSNRCSGPPEVEILEPTGVAEVPFDGTATLRLRVTHPDQPADTLTCKVGSSVTLGTNIASCTPTGEGEYDVVLSTAGLYEAPNADVWSVNVTDDCGRRVRAAVPVVIGGAWPAGDADGDAFVGPDDCDDADASVYTTAAELADGKDNDCDNRTDEGTVFGDDDGDGVTEAEGDCDDNDAYTYPAGPEIADDGDNDCDGTIDEGTPRYDDDGDGFAEEDLDCNDADVRVSPMGVELCGNGIDDDCNGLKDSQEPCGLPVDAELAGGVQLSQTHAVSGDQVTARVYPTGDTTLAWAAPDGALSATTGEAVVWTAPDVLEPTEIDLGVLATTPDGTPLVAHGTVTVFPNETSLGGDEEAVSPMGCATGSGPWWLALAGALGARFQARRRASGS
jgi:hypothetical protein